MRILGLAQGPLVGKARDFLLELRMAEGELGYEQVVQELVGWAAAAGIPVPAPEPPEPPGPPEPGED